MECDLVTQKPNPHQAAQARSKIEQMKRTFDQKRAVAEGLSGIKYKIGVYSGKVVSERQR